MVYKLMCRRYQLSYLYYQTDSPFDYDLVRFPYTKSANEKLENNLFGPEDKKNWIIFFRKVRGFSALRSLGQ